MEINCAFAPITETPDHIQLAEELGYSRAWVFDTPAVQLDVYATLAAAAVKTKRIGLGPGVIIPSLRHIMVTASAIATLVGLAPGRVNMAIGTGFSGRFAMGKKPNKWDFVASYARQLKGLLAGEIVEVEGAMTRMMHGPEQAPARPIEVPLLFGTAGPRGEALARELADGIFTVIPVASFERQSLLAQGTVLDPGEPSTPPARSMPPEVAPRWSFTVPTTVRLRGGRNSRSWQAARNGARTSSRSTRPCVICTPTRVI